MTGPDVLDKAADYIAEHGWARRTFQTPAGEVCAMEAITRSSPNGDFSAHEAFTRYLRARKLTERGVVYFNDYVDDQTAENVIATMRACAASLRAAS